jgi:glycosyltransferase involved in cell wall biosynthesis
VIATPVGCVPALIHHGENGWLVPARDASALTAAMRTLLADADLRRRIGKAGRASVLGMTWAETARRTLDVYDAAISHRSRHRSTPLEATSCESASS